MNILVLETSTTSAKAMLYNTELKTYQVETKILDKFYDDVTLHDPKAVYEQTLRLGKELCQRATIDMITIVTTWHSLLLCNDLMEPITPTYLWSNNMADNTASQMKADRKSLENYYKKTGCIPSSTYPYLKLKHLLEEENLNLDHTYICDQGSYNYFQLTGRFATSNTMASGSGLYDLNKDEYDHEILNELSIKRHQLPAVEAYNKVTDSLVTLSKDAKEYLGVENDVLVTVASPDGAMNQLGSSGRATTSMTLSVGTSGAIRMYARRPLLSKTLSTWCYKMGEGWLAGGATSGACSYVEDEKDKLFAKSITYERLEKDLLDLHNQIVTNKESFMKQCYYMPFNYGERSPGWNMDRSGGYRLNKKASDIELYRSVLEGVLFNLYQCYTDLVAISEIPLEVRLSGGILNSDYWVQMCADIFGRTITIDPQIQTSLVGGVEFAMNSLGKTIFEDDATIEKVVVPNAKLHELYKQRYEKYLYLYESNE